MDTTATLEHGFTDSKGVTHKTVTFGRRLTGLDLFEIDRRVDSLGQSASECLIFDTALAAFGELPKSATVDALLSLDSLELSEVSRAYDSFLALSSEGHAAKTLADDMVKLAYGCKRDDVVYDVVTFGKRLKGWDEVAADRLSLTGAKRACYLIGRQVTKLSQSDSDRIVDGPIELGEFEIMDADDIFTLQRASIAWREAWYKAARSKAANQQSDSVN